MSTSLPLPVCLLAVSLLTGCFDAHTSPPQPAPMPIAASHPAKVSKHRHTVRPVVPEAPVESARIVLYQPGDCMRLRGHNPRTEQAPGSADGSLGEDFVLQVGLKGLTQYARVAPNVLCAAVAATDQECRNAGFLTNHASCMQSPQSFIARHAAQLFDMPAYHDHLVASGADTQGYHQAAVMSGAITP